MRKFLYAAAAATALFSTAAMATVTFDPDTGTGFVGKGDVQLAFGWNNAAAQTNGRSVTFTYNVTATYDVECEWYTTAGPNTIHHDITIPRHVSVNDTIQYDARTHKQIDGYILIGFGSEQDDGTIPEVGDTCPGHSDEGTVTNVTPTSSSGDGDGLFVNWNGLSVLIWP